MEICDACRLRLCKWGWGEKIIMLPEKQQWQKKNQSKVEQNYGKIVTAKGNAKIKIIYY